MAASAVRIRFDHVHREVQFFRQYPQENSAQASIFSGVNVGRIWIYSVLKFQPLLFLIENAHVESVPIEIDGASIRQRRQRTQHPSFSRPIHAFQLSPC